MKDNSLVPSNEIWYTSVDDKPLSLPRSTRDIMVSNTYNDGKGVIVFNEPVVEITSQGFWGCDSLQEIVIPECVTSIRVSAFFGCTALRKITIPSRVTKIGYMAFCGCTQLEEVVIRSSATYIAHCSFLKCDNLKTIYVPKKTVDFYKERFLAGMLIAELGTDLPVIEKTGCNVPYGSVCDVCWYKRRYCLCSASSHQVEAAFYNAKRKAEEAKRKEEEERVKAEAKRRAAEEDLFKAFAEKIRKEMAEAKRMEEAVAKRKAEAEAEAKRKAEEAKRKEEEERKEGYKITNLTGEDFYDCTIYYYPSSYAYMVRPDYRNYVNTEDLGDFRWKESLTAKKLNGAWCLMGKNAYGRFISTRITRTTIFCEHHLDD